MLAVILCLPMFFKSSISGYEDVVARALWVNQTYDAMTMDQRLGQLFMVRAFSKGNVEHEKYIEDLIKKYHIGGLCFFQGSPKHQVRLTNRYQAMSRLPLMISIDAEWGLGMRFKDQAISFPRQLTMGAIRNNRVIYDFGTEVADQLKRMGVHMNFAPVVDVNNNPANPVINNRSFGEHKQDVTAKAYAYIRGLQDHGVLACAKHFPGHGDTEVDSHYDLPIIPYDRSRLDSIELYPFRILSQFGVASMMIAHLQVPSMDSTPNLPTTLSYPVVTDILKKEIGYKGLIVTDALDMKGVTKHHQKGALEVKAFQAGNDILLLSEDVPRAIAAIKAAIESGEIPSWRVEESVKKILDQKHRLGLAQFQSLDEDNLYQDIVTAKALSIKGRIYEEALTCVRDDQQLLPLGDELEGSIGSLSLGVGQKTIFQRRLEAYHSTTSYTAGIQTSASRASGLYRALSEKDVVVISLHDYKKNPKNNHGISTSAINLIKDLSRSTKVIVVAFGSPYVLRLFDQVPTVLQAYEEDEIAQDFCAQAIFGVFDIRGKLPVKASDKSVLGSGRIVRNNGRLGYVIPEVVGMNSDTLEKMDSIVEEIISKRAAPGCQVLVARKGKVVFHRSYGFHDYNKGKKVQLNDLYDVASITKVAATTVALMKLQDMGLLDLDQTLSHYFPELDTTNKGDLIIRDILAHHARLPGWIPFYESTKTGTKRLSGEWYRKKVEGDYTIPVAQDLFLRNDFRDTIIRRIAEVDLRTKPGYRYSDLGFYLFDRLVKKQSGMRLDSFCDANFYQPMGLRHIGFQPLKKGISTDLIPPTEEDNYFRTQRIQGYVHDMGAAMQGGVAGHAGLFSNAHDLASLFQMLLRGGRYANKPYLSEGVIQQYTRRHPASTRRGLGFDMKELNPENVENMCSEASTRCFGHLGFTGTAVWADPEEDLIFVFLSNRTYPSMKNSKLHKENYRPKLQSLAYEAIQKI